MRRVLTIVTAAALAASLYGQDFAPARVLHVQLDDVPRDALPLVVSEATVGCAVTPLFALPEAELDRLYAAVVRRHGKNVHSGHLGSWLRVEAPSVERAGWVLSRLRSLECVQRSYFEPEAVVQSVAQSDAQAVSFAAAIPDIPPTTPDFRPRQSHRGAAPAAFDFNFANAILGGRARGVRAVHVENGWILGHEDLSKVNASAFIGSPNSSTRPLSDHGIGVAGVLVADRNGFGVTGVVDELSLRLSAFASHGGVAGAITQALAASSPGDLLMLIVGIDIAQVGPRDLVPLEYVPSYFQAVQAATSAGLHVVEASGNGGVDLDHPRFGGIFDPSVRDSGAILVGATSAANPVRLPASNWGQRVDANGWGRDVVTPGGGSLFEPNGDARQAYTASFGGTSAGATLVAAVVAATIGILRQQENREPSVTEMRDLVRRLGTPVGAGIGKRPSLRAILGSFGLPDGLTPSSHVVARGGQVSLALDGPANGTSFVLAGTAIRRTSLGLNRDIHLDLGSAVTLGAVPLSAAGTGSLTLPIPNGASLQGLALRLQCVRSGAAGLSVSTSGEIVID